MDVYSPDIPVNRFSGLHIIYPQVLELALSQSHIPGENAAQFSAAVVIRTVPIFVHLVPITNGWTSLHYISIDGIRSGIDS